MLEQNVEFCVLYPDPSDSRWPSDKNSRPSFYPTKQAIQFFGTGLVVEKEEVVEDYDETVKRLQADGWILGECSGSGVQEFKRRIRA